MVPQTDVHFQTFFLIPNLSNKCITLFREILQNQNTFSPNRHTSTASSKVSLTKFIKSFKITLNNFDISVITGTGLVQSTQTL